MFGEARFCGLVGPDGKHRKAVPHKRHVLKRFPTRLSTRPPEHGYVREFAVQVRGIARAAGLGFGMQGRTGRNAKMCWEVQRR